MEMANEKQASILYALWKRVRRALAAGRPDDEDEVTRKTAAVGASLGLNSATGSTAFSPSVWGVLRRGADKSLPPVPTNTPGKKIAPASYWRTLRGFSEERLGEPVLNSRCPIAVKPGKLDFHLFATQGRRRTAGKARVMHDTDGNGKAQYFYYTA